MSAALYNVYKKNMIFIIVAVVVFMVVKGIAIDNVSGQKKKQDALELWVSQCADMSEDELKEFVSDIKNKVLTDKESKELINEFNRFNRSYENADTINRLIYFAEHKEGFLPIVLPANYLELLDFYKNLNAPQVINEEPLDIYFKLQSYDIVIFLVVFLMAIFFGQHYELEIYKYTQITRSGRVYNRTIRISIFAMSYLFLFANELIDVLYSGLLLNSHLLNASVQSYSDFAYAQINAQMKGCLMLSLFSKVVGMFIVCTCFEWIARKKKSMKNTIIYSACAIMAIFFLGQALSDSSYYSLLQIGIVDWRKIIEGTRQYVSLGISSLELGCIVTLAVGVTVTVLSYKRAS